MTNAQRQRIVDQARAMRGPKWATPAPKVAAKLSVRADSIRLRIAKREREAREAARDSTT